MKSKFIQNYRVVSSRHLSGGRYVLLVMVPALENDAIPAGIRPGQFVQIAVEAPGVFLRRPISINYVDYDHGTIWLLVRDAGKATHRLMQACEGDIYNIVLPLGNGFTLPAVPDCRPLLVGGGVGVAPLLHLGSELSKLGMSPEFLLGARSEADLLEMDEFKAIGQVHVSTDDGSLGHHGLVGDNPVLTSGDYNIIYCCGPGPMMKAVAKVARQRGITCEVSLENMMACGLGACLCCVEKTVKGNQCVCTAGPVFNIDQLTW